MELSECITFGNVFLAIVFFLILNQMIELYQLRNMPPGPRLTSLPFIGNMLSFDSGESFGEVTRRFVSSAIHKFLVQHGQVDRRVFPFVLLSVISV